MAESLTAAPAAPRGNGAGAHTGADSGVLYLAGAFRERAAVRERLERAAPRMVVTRDLTEAVSQLALERFALCVIDLTDERLALGAIRLIRSLHPHQAVAGVIDPAHPVVAGQAVHAGIGDLLPWPFEDRDLQALISNAREQHGVDVEIARPGSMAEALFAQSPAMRGVLDQVQEAADGRRGVCIVGEPGSGRELVARLIHAGRTAEPGPFVAVDCAARTPDDLERGLFGADADRRVGSPSKHLAPERVGRAGALVAAGAGTVYLTNLCEAPSRVQARLARLLRDREALMADEGVVIDLRCRVIGSFEPDVDLATGDGRLRRDLFDRLAHHRIDVPPLRRRRQDIPLLATHFLAGRCEALGLPPRSFSRSALALLSALPWQGNATELRELIEAVLRAERGEIIQLDHLLEHASLEGVTARIEAGMTLRAAKARFERECISAVLLRHHGRVGEAARALGIQRTNLYRKVRQLNVARALLWARK